MHRILENRGVSGFGGEDNAADNQDCADGHHQGEGLAKNHGRRDDRDKGDEVNKVRGAFGS